MAALGGVLARERKLLRHGSLKQNRCDSTVGRMLECSLTERGGKMADTGTVRRNNHGVMGTFLCLVRSRAFAGMTR